MVSGLPSVEGETPVPVPLGKGLVKLPDHDGVCDPARGGVVLLRFQSSESDGSISTVVVVSTITVVLLGGASDTGMVAFGSGDMPPVPPVRRPLVAEDVASMMVVTDSTIVELLQADVVRNGPIHPVPLPVAPPVSRLVADGTAVSPIHEVALKLPVGRGTRPPVPPEVAPLDAPADASTWTDVPTIVVSFEYHELHADGNGLTPPVPPEVAPPVALAVSS